MLHPFEGILDLMSEDRKKYHLCLGDLIDILKNTNQDLIVEIEGPASPMIGLKNPHSYRGYYDDLSFEPSDENITVEQLLNLCEECMGKSFQGWKGGDFVMCKDTPLWISFEGDPSGLAVIYALVLDGKFKLITKYTNDEDDNC